MGQKVGLEVLGGDSRGWRSDEPSDSVGILRQGRSLPCAGRRREKDPDGSPYNRLVDMEWQAPPGDTRSCGGDAMFRIEAFEQVGGFDARLIAGEEPDLCVRLRRADWRVIRLDEPMTIHDADIHSFSQWWRREMRAGHAYAEGLLLHLGGPERFRWRAVASIVWWGVLMPLVALVGGLAVHGALFVIAALGYAVPWSRMAMQTRTRQYAVINATGITFGKIPEFAGVLLLIYHRSIRGRSTPLIEYKHET